MKSGIPTIEFICAHCNAKTELQGVNLFEEKQLVTCPKCAKDSVMYWEHHIKSWSCKVEIRQEPPPKQS